MRRKSIKREPAMQQGRGGALCRRAKQSRPGRAARLLYDRVGRAEEDHPVKVHDEDRRAVRVKHRLHRARVRSRASIQHPCKPNTSERKTHTSSRLVDARWPNFSRALAHSPRGLSLTARYYCSALHRRQTGAKRSRTACDAACAGP
eukprot:4591921-Pleurochrysis_carterae.AAC.2